MFLFQMVAFIFFSSPLAKILTFSFIDSDEDLIKNSIIKRTNLSVNQIVLIVAICAIFYLIFSFLLIVYCKRRVFKKNFDSTVVDNTGMSFQNTNISNDERSQMIVKKRESKTSGLLSDRCEAHPYESIEDNGAKFEIKKFLNNKKPLFTSQSSFETDFTLRSLSNAESTGADYLKSLKNFTFYGLCCYGEVCINYSIMFF